VTRRGLLGLFAAAPAGAAFALAGGGRAATARLVGVAAGDLTVVATGRTGGPKTFMKVYPDGWPSVVAQPLPENVGECLEGLSHGRLVVGRAVQIGESCDVFVGERALRLEQDGGFDADGERGVADGFELFDGSQEFGSVDSSHGGPSSGLDTVAQSDPSASGERAAMSRTLRP
jgi:hypothetical protein